MKKYFVLFILTLGMSSTHAFEWSVNEYLENCSVVDQKILSAEDKEIVGYCRGLLKGSLFGIMITSSLESDQMKMPSCLIKDKKKDKEEGYLDLQKEVLASIRLKYKNLAIANEPNMANTVVSFTLIDLYPCLIE